KACPVNGACSSGSADAVPRDGHAGHVGDEHADGDIRVESSTSLSTWCGYEPESPTSWDPALDVVPRAEGWRGLLVLPGLPRDGQPVVSTRPSSHARSLGRVESVVGFYPAALAASPLAAVRHAVPLPGATCKQNASGRLPSWQPAAQPLDFLDGPRRSRTCDPLIKRPGVRAYDGPALAGIAW